MTAEQPPKAHMGHGGIIFVSIATVNALATVWGAALVGIPAGVIVASLVTSIVFFVVGMVMCGTHYNW